MRKIDRVRAALADEVVDRPPFSFWTHLPGPDLEARALADATLAFAERYDVDFVKSMPNNLFVVEDWGCTCDYSEVASGGAGKVTEHAVRAARDWRAIGALDPTAGALGRELDALSRVVAALGAEGPPVLATVFSPLTVARKLSGPAFARSVTESGADLCVALANIASTMAGFARAALERGVAGVFFATQQATHSELTNEQFRRFGRPYDRQVLAAASEGWFNVLHIHGANIMFDLVADYDVHALSWHVGETPPTLREYLAAGGAKAIVGGLTRSRITSGDLTAVTSEIEDAVAATAGRKLLLAPNCSIRHPVSASHLDSLIATIKAARLV